MALKPQIIIDAVASLGGKARLSEIYDRVSLLASERGITLPPSYQSSIRGRIEERSSDSEVWQRNPNKREDIFYSVFGIGDGAWGLRSMQGLGEDWTFEDPAQDHLLYKEGERQLKLHLKRERSRKLVRDFKNSLSNLSCCVCDFNFFDAYGAMGEKFIEAHHIIPLSQTEKGRETTIKDLVPVCSNCHRMLHVRDDLDHIQLREIFLQRRLSDAAQ